MALAKTWTWFEGEWLEGNPPLMGPQTHAFWLGTSVFDGARAFEGVMPDLDLHLDRVNRSAVALGLKPTQTVAQMRALTEEGVARFGEKPELYIRPMYWGESAGAGVIVVDPESTRFCLCIYEAAMPVPKGFSVTLSPFRRPTLETMPVNAKAGCLYPNNARAIAEAHGRGFDNCLVADMLGNIAELGSANVFMVKDGVVRTPASNGTFLAGITRHRVLALLRSAGYTVEEGTLSYRDFQEADEIFSAGNYGKVQPITRIDQRDLQPGPVYKRARELYWAFAHGA